MTEVQSQYLKVKAHLKLASKEMLDLISLLEDEENPHDMATVEDIRELLLGDVVEPFTNPGNFLSEKLTGVME